MAAVPSALVQRLTVEEVAALERLLGLVDAALRSAYREALLDHRESRGDDAQLFGMRVYKYARYALLQAVADDLHITFLEHDGAYSLAVGPLRIRVDVLGHFADEDVRGCFPDASRAKRAFGVGNQLALDLDDVAAFDDACFEANLLNVGHFGNPREGLVKWYLGAWRDAKGRRSWAWIERMDETGQIERPLPVPTATIPFHERRADHVIVRPRRSA